MNRPHPLLAALLAAASLGFPALASAELSPEEKKACREQWPGKDKAACANLALIDVEVTGNMGKDFPPVFPLSEYVAGQDFGGGLGAGAAFAMPASISMKAAPKLHMLKWPVIFFNDALFALAKDYNAGACAMAHELAHLQLDHIPKRYARLRARYGPWKAQKGPAFFQSRTEKEAQRTFLVEEMMELLHRQEKEADQRAFVLLSNRFSSIDRQGCLSLMKQLAASENEAVVDPTHPMASERLRELEVLDETVAAPKRGPAVVVPQSAESLKSIEQMTKSWQDKEDAQKAELAKICPQVGIDDHGNPVYQNKQGKYVKTCDN